MSEAVIVALITGILSLAGIIVTSVLSTRATMAQARRTQAETIEAVKHQSELDDQKLSSKLEQHQAITDLKIDELTREVRAHNNFAQRLPVIEEQIKVINHRIDDLESDAK